MASRFAPGDLVQTPLGKGVVREVRKTGRLLVDVKERSVLFEQDTLSPVEPRRGRMGPKRPATASSDVNPNPASASRSTLVEIDLHGLPVADALTRAEEAIDDALLADRSELRLIHGRSGGRIRASLHRRLAEIPGVRGFRLDPRNPGVTIVTL